MSLARAFTTRRGKLSTDLGDASKMPLRSNTTKTIRHKISAPIELVHTTNMLSYNAPDLPRYAHNRTELSSPRRSEDDSSTVKTNESTPPTSPDIAPGEPASNHLSSYFTAPRHLPGLNVPAKIEDDNDDKLEGFNVPTIPTRSPSHTKKASQDASNAKKASYDAVRRQRSASNVSRSSDHTVSSKPSMTFSRSSSTSTNTSASSYLSASHSVKLSAPPMPMPRSPLTPVSAAGKESHPFGQELAQVTELVEEYVKEEPRSQPRIYDEDEEYILSKGLAQFSPAEYLLELDQITSSFFPEVPDMQTAGPLWI
ncbi:hypothetical protein S40285_00559 [Stachybotrys chlorohalonatus IBT 40285]|uniref:Uncharacterized protein n=1 Tax=Stachybotrys chlorohalonatus (strain IBT 40285) TaxID=1283841 RepID=A0A084R2M8_STAC4|nr:hypothetical protein S40285_00559 [Stachybotrys chlorohalonata IBT 40285]